MTDHIHGDIPKRVLALKSIFAETPAYLQLQQELSRLLGHRRAQIACGTVTEMRGIALIGASGSGKSTHVERLINTTPDLCLPREGREYCEIVSVMVPSPATLKSVGRAILEALGRPMKRERTADAIWELVRGILRERQVLFLLLDEAQDITRHQTPKEMQAVINTLKSLMQNKTWPVGLILAGMPGLREMLNHDPQLARRVSPIELPRLNPLADMQAIQDMIVHYAGVAELGTPDGSRSADLAARLIHAADREFGLSIEITIESMEEAMRTGANEVAQAHFAAAYQRRSGCIAGLNPFIVDDYERIDTRKLLGRGEDEGDHQ